jgi:hypothetical protein
MRARSVIAWTIGIAIALVLVGLLLLGGFQLWILYPHVMPAEQLAAIAAIIGGGMGALGAAGAVYLTLSAQRRDDVDKFVAAARMEVVELGRAAADHLGSAIAMFRGESRVPVGDLHGLSAMAALLTLAFSM